MISKIKSLITNMGNWCDANKKQIFILGVVIQFVLILALTVSLLVAFWLMGLYSSKYNFPLQIGVSAVVGIVGGIGSLYTLYKSNDEQDKTELKKWEIDSVHNSVAGQMPEKRNRGESI